MKRITRATRMLLATGAAMGLLAACDPSSAITPSTDAAVCADDQLSEFVPGSRHLPLC